MDERGRKPYDWDDGHDPGELFGHKVHWHQIADEDIAEHQRRQWRNPDTDRAFQRVLEGALHEGARVMLQMLHNNLANHDRPAEDGD